MPSGMASSSSSSIRARPERKTGPLVERKTGPLGERKTGPLVTGPSRSLETPELQDRKQQKSSNWAPKNLKRCPQKSQKSVRKE